MTGGTNIIHEVVRFNGGSTDALSTRTPPPKVERNPERLSFALAAVTETLPGMKANSIRYQIRLAMICCACIGTAVAQSSRETDAQSSRSSGTRTSANNPQSSNIDNVRVTRASNFLGSDVIASDNRKVGDIVDYYFDLGATQHLAYVVIMTGGFLDMGGDRRAVPASAVTTSGDNCRINISSDRFWDVPVLPENRDRYLSDMQNRQRISQIFRDPTSTSSARSSDTDRARTSDTVSTGRTTSSSSSSSTSSASESSQAGAMTGRAGGQGQSQLVSFSELRNADAYGQQDSRLGFFVDAWINLNDNRAPYVEITPTFEPFRTNFDRRYAVPTAKLAQKRDFQGYNVNISTDELNKAEPVSETEGVKMLQEGRIGNAVLRVTVPEK